MKIIITCVIITFSLIQKSAFCQEFLWAGKIGGWGSERSNAITSDSFGNIYNAGYFYYGPCDFDPGLGVYELTSTNGSDAYVSKLNSNGEFVWAVNFAGSGFYDAAHAITTDLQGSIYVTGTYTDSTDFDPSSNTYTLPTNGSNDVFVCKLDSNGSFLWAKHFGGTNGENGFAIAIDAYGDVILTGVFQSTISFDSSGSNDFISNGNFDIFVCKLNSASGNIIWAKAFGGIDYDQSVSITSDEQGQIYVFGNFSGTVDFDPGTSVNELTSVTDKDAFILKLNNGGDFVWVQHFVGSNLYARCYATSIQYKFGYLHATGYFYYTVDFDPSVSTFNLTTSGYNDIFITKLDTLGNLIWAKKMGGNYFDEARALITDQQGNIYSAGNYGSTDADFDPGLDTFTLSATSGNCAFLSKLDSGGNFIWAVSTSGTGQVSPRSLAIGGFESVYASGDFQDTADFNPGLDTFNLIASGVDAFILKLTQNSLSALSLSIVVSDTVGCSTSCTADLDLTVSGGTPPYTYQWMNGATAEDIIDVCDGTYYVTVTDGVGSTVIDTVTVTSVLSPCEAPTVVNITNLASNSSQINWTGNDCAVKYRVRVKNMSNGVTNLYFVNAPVTTKSLTNLTANTTYQVRVRTQCTTNGSIVSPWSSAVYFTTLGATNCTYPTNISANSTSNSTATIIWTPIANSSGYQLRYKPMGQTSWNPVVIIPNGSTSSYNLTSLSPNTTYKYQLRTKCSINPLTWSNFSPIQTFTTPLRLGEEDIANQILLYPNPSNGTITFNSNNLVGTLYVYDIVGKEILHQVVSENEITSRDLPNGLLTYRFVSENGLVKTDKFVVIR